MYVTFDRTFQTLLADHGLFYAFLKFPYRGCFCPDQILIVFLDKISLYCGQYFNLRENPEILKIFLRLA